MSNELQIAFIVLLSFVLSAELSYYVIRAITSLPQPKIMKWQSVIAIPTTLLVLTYLIWKN